MGERWEPLCYADLRSCEGRPETWALLSFLAMRSRSRPYEGPLGRRTLVQEALSWSGWGRTKLKSHLCELEAMPGVHLERDGRGHVLEVWTDALRRRDAERATGRGDDPSAPNGDSPGGAQATPRGRPGDREGSPPRPLDLFSSDSDSPTPEREESLVNRRGRRGDPSALPRTDPGGGMKAAGPVAGPDAAAGPRTAEGLDGGASPGGSLPTLESRLAIARAALQKANAEGSPAAALYAAQLRELERSA